jgi:predicted aspartyl protease
VVEWVKRFLINMDGMENSVVLNILTMGSYDLLIGMDWIENHTHVVNCKKNELFV